VAVGVVDGRGAWAAGVPQAASSMSAASAITGAGFAMGYPVNAGAGRVLRRQIDVLQADLPPRHQLAVLGPRNVDLQELLGGALVNRFCDISDPTPVQRTDDTGHI